MRNVGYRFYIEGEYTTDAAPDDPKEGDWQPFDMRDLHPAGEGHITIWPANCREPNPESEAEAIQAAAVVIDWMRTWRRWEGFIATLWLMTGKLPGKRVFHWELC